MAAAREECFLEHSDGTNDYRVRKARDEDVPAMAAIFNWYVEHTVISFGYHCLSHDDMLAKLRARQKLGWPFFVAERRPRAQTGGGEGEVVGMAYAAPFRGGWDAYEFVAETSIYLRHDLRSRGLGKRMYKLLIDTLYRENDIRHFIGVVSEIEENPQSRRLHLGLGFRESGTLDRIGWKQGRWLSVTYFHLVVPDEEMQKQFAKPHSRL